MYCSIIGDIVDSRTLENRSDVQKKLNNILKKLNEEYKNKISAGLTITIGDEFQGLFNSTDSIFKIIDYIKMEMYPVKIRFGVGIGDIDTDIVSDYAIGADGPVYHNAREALDEIKTSNGKYLQPVQDTRINYTNTKNQAGIGIINAALSACTLIENTWTDKQREVIRMLMEEDISQRVVAEKLNTKPAAIQKRLAGSDYITYRYILDSVELSLNTLWESVNYG